MNLLNVQGTSGFMLLTSQSPIYARTTLDSLHASGKVMKMLF